MTLLSQAVASPTRTQETRTAPLSRGLHKVVLLLVVLDSVVVITSLLLAWSLRSRMDELLPAPFTHDSGLGSELTPWVFLIWMGCLLMRGAYRRHGIGAGFDEFRQVSSASVAAILLLATLAFLTQSEVSRGFLILAFLIGVPLLLTERYAVRKGVHAARKRGRLRGRVIAVCGPTALSELLTSLSRMDHLGLNVVGTCMPGVGVERALDLPVPCYGGVDSVLAACRETGADTVIVAGEGSSTSAALRKLGWTLEGSKVDLIVLPNLIDVAGPRIHMRHVSGLPLVYVEEPQAGRAGGIAKRLFDVLFASAMLVLASPVMLAAALAIKLGDRGPVLFRQERIGRNGERFMLTKFRSMVVGAEHRMDEVIEFNHVDDVLFKMPNDPRVTGVGSFLRRFSIDELPQLIDVLRGEMSLVGPRPLLPAQVQDQPTDMRRRMLVRPGLTGLWQVSGRSDLSFNETIRMDLYYVDNWSITADVIIMMKTVRAVLLPRGAY